MASRSVVLLFVVLVTAGCPEGLPAYDRVVDMRLLGIRAEPPAFLVGNPLIDGAEPLSMGFSALVVDPRGRVIDYTWSFCPVESFRACTDYEDRRLDASPANRPLLDAMRADLAEDTKTARPINDVIAPPNDAFSQRGAWPYAIDAYAPTAPPELTTFHFFENALGLGLGAWPSAVLQLESSGEELLASKRIVVGLRDLRSAANQIAAEVGATVCPGDEQEPGCIVVRNAVANTNPVFAGVQVAEGQSPVDADYQSIDISADGTAAGPITVGVEEAIRIRPVIEQDQIPDADDWRVHPEYHYQTFRVDLETEELIVEDLFEEVSVSWFLTGGSFSDSLTWPKFTKTLDTVWTAPKSPPSDGDGRITLWMVARDQRGGVSWMSIEVVVE